jgi:hypothetical protein
LAMQAAKLPTELFPSPRAPPHPTPYHKLSQLECRRKGDVIRSSEKHIGEGGECGVGEGHNNKKRQTCRQRGTTTALTFAAKLHKVRKR